MFPFQIRPDRALAEIQEFGLKLSHGLKTLSEIGDIEVGATEKDAVYTEDKVVLYRFRPLVENPRPRYRSSSSTPWSTAPTWPICKRTARWSAVSSPGGSMCT